MSKLKARHIFTSESVGEGHPDKVCDQISDAILDECLKLDEGAHVACETAVGTNFCANLGEITCKGWEAVDTEKIARKVVEDIGYTFPSEGFAASTFRYVNALHGQSPDIAQGVNKAKAEDQGAGDQGMMFGYAANEGWEYMPAPIFFATGLMRKFHQLRHAGVVPFLRPDAKAQVSVLYDNGRPVSIESVVIAHQTTEVPINVVRSTIKDLAATWLNAFKNSEGKSMLTGETKWFINATGKFVVGGPDGDSGLTGRKIICDTYGGVGSHGGGAFSGKDPSKVDRSAAYYARYMAKNIVHAGLAEKCEVQVAYSIGVAHPVSVNVCTYGTGVMPDEELEKIIVHSGLFDFRPGVFIKALGLTKPEGWCYRDTSNYGHFGKPDIKFPWEVTDKSEYLHDEARKFLV